MKLLTFLFVVLPLSFCTKETSKDGVAKYHDYSNIHKHPKNTGLKPKPVSADPSNQEPSKQAPVDVSTLARMLQPDVLPSSSRGASTPNRINRRHSFDQTEQILTDRQPFESKRKQPRRRRRYRIRKPSRESHPQVRAEQRSRSIEPSYTLDTSPFKPFYNNPPPRKTKISPKSSRKYYKPGFYSSKSPEEIQLDLLNYESEVASTRRLSNRPRRHHPDEHQTRKEEPRTYPQEVPAITYDDEVSPNTYQQSIYSDLPDVYDDKYENQHDGRPSFSPYKKESVRAYKNREPYSDAELSRLRPTKPFREDTATKRQFPRKVYKESDNIRYAPSLPHETKSPHDSKLKHRSYDNRYNDGVAESLPLEPDPAPIKEKRETLYHGAHGGYLDKNGQEFVAETAKIEKGVGDGRIDFQIHGHNGPHSYKFGYDTGKGYNRQFRYEERDAYGMVKGRYGFYDKDGKLQVVNYSAHPKYGFNADVPNPHH